MRCSLSSVDPATGAATTVVGATGACALQSLTALAADATTAILGSQSGSLWQVDLATHRILAIAATGLDSLASVALTGSTIYVGTQDGVVVRVELGSGASQVVVGVPGRRQVVTGPLPGGLYSPSDLVVLADGSLAIVDAMERSVLRASFTP